MIPMAKLQETVETGSAVHGLAKSQTDLLLNNNHWEERRENILKALKPLGSLVMLVGGKDPQPPGFD